MEQVGISHINQEYIQKLPKNGENNKDISSQAAPKTDGKNKIILGLSAIATIAIAGVAIYKHNNRGTHELISKLLSDIKFDKGVASLDDGKKFTGIIEDTLRNGDKIKLEYKDGVIQKSTRKGKANFEKIFEILEDGNHKVTTNVGENQSSVIMEELKEKATKSQEKLEAILNKKDSLSLDELKKQADELTNISKQQKEQIASIVSDKEKQAQMATTRVCKDVSEEFEKLLDDTSEKYAEGSNEHKFLSFVKKIISKNNKEDVQFVADSMLLAKGCDDIDPKCYDEIFNAYKIRAKEKFGVEILAPEKGSNFDGTKMHVSDTVKTDNPELNGKVADIFKYGSLDKNGNGRAPEVILYKYE